MPQTRRVTGEMFTDCTENIKKALNCKIGGGGVEGAAGQCLGARGWGGGVQRKKLRAHGDVAVNANDPNVTVRLQMVRISTKRRYKRKIMK